MNRFRVKNFYEMDIMCCCCCNLCRMEMVCWYFKIKYTLLPAVYSCGVKNVMIINNCCKCITQVV